MSIAHARKIITIPAFQSLPTDVTPIIVGSMRSSSIRSLAQTSKCWNTYLKRVWDLDLRNYGYAARQITQHRMPLVRTLDMAENLYREVSKRKAGKFVEFIFPHLDITGPSRTNVRTLLSGRTGKVMPGSLQEALASHEGWDAGSQVDEKKVKQLVASCFSPIKAERTLLKDVMKACTMLPDKFKTIAFVSLMERLFESEQFKVDDDSFWRRMKIPRSEFLALLPELIPETWSPSLTIAGDHVFALKRNIMYGNSSFGLAVQACLQNFGEENPALTFAILRLVKTSASNLGPKNQNWSGIGKHLKKQKGFEERRLMKELLYCVIQWGRGESAVKQQCTRMLCGSGFMSLMQWSKLKNQSKDRIIHVLYDHL
jgi:hypothetical protein